MHKQKYIHIQEYYTCTHIYTLTLLFVNGSVEIYVLSKKFKYMKAYDR